MASVCLFFLFPNSREDYKKDYDSRLIVEGFDVNGSTSEVAYNPICSHPFPPLCVKGDFTQSTSLFNPYYNDINVILPVDGS